jgi:hypothetical protein
MVQLDDPIWPVTAAGSRRFDARISLATILCQLTATQNSKAIKIIFLQLVYRFASFAAYLAC